MIDGSNLDQKVKLRQTETKRASPLELLHPDGSASTSFVIGSNCPGILLPEPQTEFGEDVALVILAPSIDECRTNGWLVEAVQMLACKLEADGVGYVLAPPRWRFKIVWLLHRSGLLIDLAIGHLPDWERSAYLVPFIRVPAGYAFSGLIRLPAWKRHLVGQWLRLPGAGQFLGYVWPAAGLVVRRRGARPLFEWLFRTDDENCRRGSALIRTSWRGQNGATVLYRFSEGDTQPSAVAKVALATNATVNDRREAMALARLGPSAEGAGARVPQLLLEQNGNCPLLLQSVVGGRPVDELLRSRPDQLSTIIAQVVGWLERWHRSTVVVRPLDVEQLNEALLSPVALLAPFLDRGEAYRKWLTARCSGVIDVPMAFVATHNDLTMANVLLDENGRLGIIDWETSEAESWPLVDFFYALTDAVMIAGGYPDRLEAFKTCFTQGGIYAPMAARWQARLVSVVGLSVDMAELCFHACWLHHAVNEQQVSRAGEARPFLQIVQWLALHCSVSEEIS